MAGVRLSDAALDDLRRAGPVTAALLLGRLRALDADDPVPGDPLVDEGTGHRVLDALDGTARIVFSVEPDGATVHALWVDGVRTEGEAYAEALDGMRRADPSEQVALARIVRRLGRLTGVRPVPRDRLRAPVPDWLADALVERAGRTRLAVAAMDAATAFETWNQFVLRPDGPAQIESRTT